MRKLYILGLAVFTALTQTVSAQDDAPVRDPLLSKKGAYILPEEGEFGLGFSANSILNYAGSLTRVFGPANPDPLDPSIPDSPVSDFLGTNGQSVFFKYMKDENTAYRARLNFNIYSARTRHAVEANDLTPDFLNPQFTEDIVSRRVRTILLSAGIEKRRGSTRLQGVYGAEGLIGFNRTTVASMYGNQMNVDFNTPESYVGAYAGSARILNDNQGSLFFLGARGFAGVEFFFAPKMSIGAEVGYTLGFSMSSTGSQTYQIWDGAAGTAREVTIETGPGVEGHGIGLDNANAAVNLFFYF